MPLIQFNQGCVGRQRLVFALTKVSRIRISFDSVSLCIRHTLGGESGLRWP